MSNVGVGDIWELRGSDRLGLVVFSRAESSARPEDVRVVPVYENPTALSAATGRDLVIPGTRSSLGRPILVASWNARGLNASYLGRLVGHVDPEVVEAARAAEMACIIPDFDLGPGAEWQGRRPKGSRALACQSFQLTELDAWDSLVEQAAVLGEGEILVFDKGSYTVRIRQRFSPLGAPTRAGEPVFITFLEGTGTGFSGDVFIPGAAPPKSVSVCSVDYETAPAGAVLFFGSVRRRLLLESATEHIDLRCQNL